MSVISLRSVSKKFKGNVLFDELSAEFEQGRTYGLVGPNGSGKSVLFKMICGFLLPDAGSVWIDPKFMAPKRAFPDRFGIMIDGPAFLPGLTGKQNLVDLAAIRNTIGEAEVREILALVGLDPDSPQKARNYSLGMKQKLGIAQALMESPDVLLLDEPFNGLDLASVGNIKKLLRQRQEDGVTIIFTSHNREDIDELSEVTLLISENRITELAGRR